MKLTSSNGLQPASDGLQATSFLLQVKTFVNSERNSGPGLDGFETNFSNVLA